MTTVSLGAVGVKVVVGLTITAQAITIQIDRTAAPQSIAIMLVSNDGDWKYDSDSAMTTSLTVKQDSSLTFREGYDSFTFYAKVASSTQNLHIVRLA